MKKKLLLASILLLQTGCTILRYTYEPAMNQVAKKGTITRITNDYIEYDQYSTNSVQTTIVLTNTFRSYYTSDGKIFKTKQIK